MSEADASSWEGKQYRVAAMICIAGAIDLKGEAQSAVRAYAEALEAFDAIDLKHENGVDPWLAESGEGTRTRFTWLRWQNRHDQDPTGSKTSRHLSLNLSDDEALVLDAVLRRWLAPDSGEPSALMPPAADPVERFCLTNLGTAVEGLVFDDLQASDYARLLAEAKARLCATHDLPE
ncbi:MAG TPA: hypothetical protein VK771_07320 [Acidimicrobiia bacterium]|nr:hypothetical protein [Acidimicrobiia bacterium]